MAKSRAIICLKVVMVFVALTSLNSCTLARAYIEDFFRIIGEEEERAMFSCIEPIEEFSWCRCWNEQEGNLLKFFVIIEDRMKAKAYYKINGVRIDDLFVNQLIPQQHLCCLNLERLDLTLFKGDEIEVVIEFWRGISKANITYSAKVIVVNRKKGSCPIKNPLFSVVVKK